MIIIVNVSEEYYNTINNSNTFGKELLQDEGFIHASTKEQFPLIIPRLEKKGISFMGACEKKSVNSANLSFL